MMQIEFDQTTTATKYTAQGTIHPTHAASRGRYQLGHQCQQIGRDLTGERYALENGLKLLVYRTTPEYRERLDCRALWLVTYPDGRSEHGFTTAEDFLAWCRAYAVTLRPNPCGFADFEATPGKEQDWAHLTINPL